MDKFNIWFQEWFQALNNFIFELNNLIEISNKYFCIFDDFPETLKTKKLLYDSLGIYNEEGKSYMWLPKKENKKNNKNA